MPKRSPEAELPLTPATFHILLSLADADRHGYAIMHEIALRTGGQLRIGPGTLYGSLKRMVAETLVEERESAGESSDERRRFYRLTPFGRLVAKAEARRLEALVQVARGVRLLKPLSV